MENRWKDRRWCCGDVVLQFKWCLVFVEEGDNNKSLRGARTNWSSSSCWIPGRSRGRSRCRGIIVITPVSIYLYGRCHHFPAMLDYRHGVSGSARPRPLHGFANEELQISGTIRLAHCPLHTSSPTCVLRMMGGEARAVYQFE